MCVHTYLCKTTCFNYVYLMHIHMLATYIRMYWVKIYYVCTYIRAYVRMYVRTYIQVHTYVRAYACSHN